MGEAALTIEFGDQVDASLNRRVHALDEAVRDAAPEGILDCVPTYRSLLVIFDPIRAQPERLTSELMALATAAESVASVPVGRLVEIPVRYGGSDGPDLRDVAAHCGLAPSDVVVQHAAVTYQTAMLGFAPGFAYLLGLPPELATPRLATPRFHVSPGSVGIAGSQTGVYALGTPGGWRIIGRAQTQLFDPRRTDPFAIHAGDQVQFVPIT